MKTRQFWPSFAMFDEWSLCNLANYLGLQKPKRNTQILSKTYCQTIVQANISNEWYVDKGVASMR